MQLEAVVGGERRRQPALRPVAGGLRERRRRHEHDRGALARGAQRGVQAGRARAHHRDVGLARGRRRRRASPGTVSARAASRPCAAYPVRLSSSSFFFAAGGSLSSCSPLRGFARRRRWCRFEVCVRAWWRAGVAAVGLASSACVVGARRRRSRRGRARRRSAWTCRCRRAEQVAPPGRPCSAARSWRARWSRRGPPSLAGRGGRGRRRRRVAGVAGAVDCASCTCDGRGATGPRCRRAPTSAAASTAERRAATTITASAMIGAFQLGVAARRVRAAAPQRRHHSCSGCQRRAAQRAGFAPPAAAALTPPAGAGAVGPRDRRSAGRDGAPAHGRAAVAGGGDDAAALDAPAVGRTEDLGGFVVVGRRLDGRRRGCAPRRRAAGADGVEWRSGPRRAPARRAPASGRRGSGCRRGGSGARGRAARGAAPAGARRGLCGRGPGRRRGRRGRRAWPPAWRRARIRGAGAAAAASRGGGGVRRRRRRRWGAAAGGRGALGAGDGQVDAAAHRQPAVGAEAVLAAVDAPHSAGRR